MRRAHGIAGHTLEELAARVGMDLPQTTKRYKGIVGQLVERVLGADAGSLDEPDFLGLRIELKTLPVGPDGRPRESTFVTTIKLLEMEETDWEDSSVYRKLRRVLWVPIEADPELALPKRRVGAAILWSPSGEQARVLRDDWERVAVLVARGEVDEIDGHLGTYLQVRPKAAHGGVRERAPQRDGSFQWTGPRGFYLRPTFTAALLGR